MYADLHCDTAFECYVKGKSFADKSLHVNLLACLENTPCIQTFAHYIPENTENKFDFFQRMLENTYRMFESIPEIIIFKKRADIAAAERDKKILAVLSVEGGDFFDGGSGDIARADFLEKNNIRFLSLCYNGGSALCGGAKSPPDAGLTKNGLETAARLWERGTVSDLSHLNHKSSMQLINSGVRVIATHSNCLAVCPSFRNLADEAIEKLIEQKSLMGINFYAPFLCENGAAAISDVERHILHVKAMGGDKILALGADFDGCDSLPRGISGLCDIKKLDISEDMLYNNVKRFLSLL